MYARCRLVAAAAVASLVLVVGGPASADGVADAWTDGNEVGADAGSGGTGGTSGGSAPPTCEWVRLDNDQVNNAGWLVDIGWGETRGAEPGAWYRRTCHHPDGSTTSRIVWVADSVDPAVLAQQAADRVPIPHTDVRLNPDAAHGAIVNFPTWLWIAPDAWHPVTAQASAGSVTVTATASPRQVVWEMGDGSRVVCDGPGTPYDLGRPEAEQSTDCSHTYRRSSARASGHVFTVTATLVWDVSWSVVGAPGGGSLGTARRSESVDLAVKEIQVVNQ